MGGLSKVRADHPNLSDEQFDCLVLRRTERPGTSGGVFARDQDFTYTCPICGNALFSSTAKFASGTGWPSFYEAINVRVRTDWRLISDGHLLGRRKEVVCAVCKGHLGHLFKGENWATPTGERYCINSASITRREIPGRQEEPRA